MGSRKKTVRLQKIISVVIMEVGYQNWKALMAYTDRRNPAYNSNGGIWNEAGNFLNAVELEPVETRVLNPTASEASYKPKQRSYRKPK